MENKSMQSGEILPYSNGGEKEFVSAIFKNENFWLTFDELPERIRGIRASERRAYQKIADIFEQCSYDYDKDSETTKAYYTAVWKDLLPEPGKAEDYRNQTICSKMIDHAENAAENGELLHMENWLDILNNCTGRGKGDTDD